MERVKSRLAGGLIVLLAALSLGAPAWGQDDEEERAKAVDKVLRDYRDDGVIEACDHTRRALRDTLHELPPEADIETPDLRPALEAGIEQVKADECEEEEPDPTPTPTPTPTAAPTTTPAPPPAPTEPPDDSPAEVAPLPGGGGDGGDGGRGTPEVTPLDPEVTPVPPAASPAPAAPPPAEPSGTPPPPTYANEDDRVPVSLLVLAGVLALVALLALLYVALSRLGWGDAKLAGIRRAWREAAFRAGGTWGDFADWLRVGR
jgi:hypothetical protein